MPVSPIAQPTSSYLHYTPAPGGSVFHQHRPLRFRVEAFRPGCRDVVTGLGQVGIAQVGLSQVCTGEGRSLARIPVQTIVSHLLRNLHEKQQYLAELFQ